MKKGKLSSVGQESTNFDVLIEEDRDGAEFVFLIDMYRVFLCSKQIFYPYEKVSGDSRMKGCCRETKQ